MVVTRFLSAAATGAERQLAADLHEAVELHLRVEGVSEAWAPGGRDRLLEVLRNDPALRWRQLRGEVTVGLPTSVVVTSYEGPAGEVQNRLICVTVDDEGRITKVAYQKL